MKKLSWIIVAIVILVIIFVNQEPKQATGETIKIGANFSLSDFGASWGEYSHDAALLAVKEINKNGGINGRPIELIFEDNHSSIKGSVDAANKLISVDGVSFMLTGWAEHTEPIIPLLASNKVLGVTVAAGSPDITKSTDWLFRVWPKDAFLSQVSSNYIKDQGYKRVAIFHTKGAWEDGNVPVIKNQLMAVGVEVIITASVNPDTNDMRSEVTRIKNASPEAVYIIALQHSTGLFIREAKKQGLETPLIFATALDNPVIIEAAGGVASLEGIVYPVYEAPRGEFVQKFTKEYGHNPGVSADTAYDAVMLLAETMKKVGSDPDAVRVELSKVMNYKGASGIISFDQYRDRMDASVKLMIVKNGKFIPLTN